MNLKHSVKSSRKHISTFVPCNFNTLKHLIHQGKAHTSKARNGAAALQPQETETCMTDTKMARRSESELGARDLPPPHHSSAYTCSMWHCSRSTRSTRSTRTMAGRQLSCDTTLTPGGPAWQQIITTPGPQLSLSPRGPAMIRAVSSKYGPAVWFSQVKGQCWFFCFLSDACWTLKADAATSRSPHRQTTSGISRTVSLLNSKL